MYNPKHINTVEADFDGIENELIWCDRKAFPYEQIKRQAECALWQQYPEKNWIAVRYPFAIGKDDYTKRLLFYVEHAMKSIPMNIDNVDYGTIYVLESLNYLQRIKVDMVTDEFTPYLSVKI